GPTGWKRSVCPAMPELPEVETVRRQLAAVLPGRRIAGVRVRLARVLQNASPEELARRTAGRVVGPPGRRGKYLLLPLFRAGGAAVARRGVGGAAGGGGARGAPGGAAGGAGGAGCGAAGGAGQVFAAPALPGRRRARVRPGGTRGCRGGRRAADRPSAHDGPPDGGARRRARNALHAGRVLPGRRSGTALRRRADLWHHPPGGG